ncbi:hypothetical protein SDC9_186518 [bioreactor metagenome]|uniref:Uncharacterized protein n=1 Tax=bioreactor metagenome TaxID=1076179 RepID=A0A645HUE2_9ZZZZ
MVFAHYIFGKGQNFVVKIIGFFIFSGCYIKGRKVGEAKHIIKMVFIQNLAPYIKTSYIYFLSFFEILELLAGFAIIYKRRHIRKFNLKRF